MNQKELDRIEGMKDGELVARLQHYSQLIGIAICRVEREQVEELSGLAMAVADEILKRLSVRDTTTTTPTMGVTKK